MLKRIALTTMTILITISMFAITPIFAGRSESASSTLDGETFTVGADIWSNNLTSVATAYFTGNAPLWVENTTLYATSSQRTTRETGYSPGGITANVTVSSGYAIKQCTATGNASLTNGKSSTLTVVAKP